MYRIQRHVEHKYGERCVIKFDYGALCLIIKDVCRVYLYDLDTLAIMLGDRCAGKFYAYDSKIIEAIDCVIEAQSLTQYGFEYTIESVETPAGVQAEYDYEIDLIAQNIVRSLRREEARAEKKY